MSIDMNYDDLVAMGLDHGARRIYFARLSSMYEDHLCFYVYTFYFLLYQYASNTALINPL